MKALKILASLALAAAAFGQMRDNQNKEMTCDNGGPGNRARYCEIREQTTPAVGLLNVDAGRNGGAVVKGWSRNDVLVRTRVEGWGDNDAAVRATASQVYVDTSGVFDAHPQTTRFHSTPGLLKIEYQSQPQSGSLQIIDALSHMLIGKLLDAL